jgi:uncharacterized membrane protein
MTDPSSAPPPTPSDASTPSATLIPAPVSACPVAPSRASESVALPLPSLNVGWEIAIMRSWQKLALTCAAALAVASCAWQLRYRSMLYEFVFRPENISAESSPARRALLPFVALAALVALALAARTLLQARRGQRAWTLHREVFCASFVVLPLLSIPAVEFQHPLFTSALIVLFSLSAAWTAARETATLHTLPDLSRRQAQVLVSLGYATFVTVIGFIAYWRYITFHSEVCDASYEVNAVAGIVRHGIPTLSVAAFFYDGQPLPAPYFNNHVPFADYLFAPFFAIYPYPSSVVWAQVVVMGAGAFGAYLVGRKWLDTRVGGVLAAFLYLLTPSVQGFCLHDIHANVVIVPCLMLAVGFMEVGRLKNALLFAAMAAICREEAPVYTVGLGLYWMFSSVEPRRFRSGIAVVVVSGILEVFFSAYLMPHFGGHPRWDHFNLFFFPERNGGSLIAALLFNPLGAIFSSTAEVKLEYFAISLVSMGGLALWGWTAGWFLVPAWLLLLPAGDPTFFSVGVNYSAPLVPAALLMGFAGIRHYWWKGAEPGAPSASLRPRRIGVAAYVLVSALLANYLYGNIGSKTYKLEYGQSPLRRENQRNYLDIIGYVDTLPPFGQAENAMWEVIDRVPKNVPILTSWAINPQLAHYDIALSYNYSGGNPAPEERVRYVVIDKLPAFQVATEPDIARLRRDHKRWNVFFENASGIIFERR